MISFRLLFYNSFISVSETRVLLLGRLQSVTHVLVSLLICVLWPFTMFIDHVFYSIVSLNRINILLLIWRGKWTVSYFLLLRHVYEIPIFLAPISMLSVFKRVSLGLNTDNRVSLTIILDDSKNVNRNKRVINTSVWLVQCKLLDFLLLTPTSDQALFPTRKSTPSLDTWFIPSRNIWYKSENFKCDLGVTILWLVISIHSNILNVKLLC